MIKHQSQSVYSNLADAGEGIAQVLPVVIVIKALQQKKSTPKLYIIEQPELHLHPYAHAAVAELMIETAERKSDCHLLIETHSEAFVLRVRRALAENRLTPDQVRIYFIEESTDKDEGSIIKPIVLNDRGTPDWWPDGIFTEAHREFQAIRKALSNR
jgi:predicted ATPase